MKKKKTTSVGATETSSNLVHVFDNGNVSSVEPAMTSMAAESTTSLRRNIAGTIERTNRFSNIDDGLVPFRHSLSSYGNTSSNIDIRDAVILCQKCYYNFAIFRNIIDLMTEFSVSRLVLKGGSKQSRDFFQAWLNKINDWDLQDRFFREYYRSGNVFLYRSDADVTQSDIRKMTQVFASEISRAEEIEVEKMVIPVRYVILNPADVQMMSALNFSSAKYFKLLSDYELARLRSPKTQEDVEVLQDLPKETQKQIKTGARVVNIPLEADRVSMVFYKKQDYEAFAVPMGYPVLEDINFKAELRKIDMAICRTMQQIVLLVTTGAKPEEGGINPKNIEALKRLFANSSVGRVLIADYTTKADFIIPAIGDLLDPKKYEVVNKDINLGLNNVFASEDKFANQQQKVEIFVSRLEQGRQAYLNNFLMPEIKRIAASLGFKNYPQPEFESIDLKDMSTLNKIYARLLEVGVLTPEQGFKALTTGILPDSTLSDEEQKDYKKKRDSGLYTPLIGGPKDPNAAGRPGGSKAPQTTKKVAPIGSKAHEEARYSMAKVRDNMVLAQELEKVVTGRVKEIHGVKKMNKIHRDFISTVLTTIISNESPEQWVSVAKDYCEAPEDKHPDRVTQVNQIAEAHQLDNYLAGLLLASKVEKHGS